MGKVRQRGNNEDLNLYHLTLKAELFILHYRCEKSTYVFGSFQKSVCSYSTKESKEILTQTVSKTKKNIKDMNQKQRQTGLI